MKHAMAILFVCLNLGVFNDFQRVHRQRSVRSWATSLQLSNLSAAFAQQRPEFSIIFQFLDRKMYPIPWACRFEASVESLGGACGSCRGMLMLLWMWTLHLAAAQCSQHPRTKIAEFREPFPVRIDRDPTWSGKPKNTPSPYIPNIT